MAEEKKRPHGRKRGETTASGDVYKRDEKLNTEGKAGNKDYSGRPNQPKEPQGDHLDRGALGDALGSILSGQMNNPKASNKDIASVLSQIINKQQSSQRRIDRDDLAQALNQYMNSHNKQSQLSSNDLAYILSQIINNQPTSHSQNVSSNDLANAMNQLLGQSNHYQQSNTPYTQLSSGGGNGGNGGNHYKPSSGSSYGSSNTRPKKKKGINKFLLFLLIAMLFVGCTMCQMVSQGSGGSSAVVSTPTPTPLPTQAPQQSSTATTQQTFSKPTTTYTDTNMSNVSTSVASGVRDKFTQLKGNGLDTVTILVYICATDLESNYGMASADINEMAYAVQSDRVNVILETGGTRRWQNTVMNTRTNERWKVTTKALIPLDRNVGMRQMTDPNTLYDFINFGVKNYPADRYMLILWDHGAGSLQGYGYDQNYPNGTMTIDQISQVLNATGVKFDLIGFDACLMATTETAMAISPYADYMIASEETEPGTGWYYTNWLSSLAKNTSLPTTEIGKQIIDDFTVASAQSSHGRDKTSLSLIDLGEFEAKVPSKLTAFAKNITSTLESQDFKTVADARSVSKEYAQSNRIDQIDLTHFALNMGTKEGQELAEAVQSCVKYNRINNMKNSYGLSIYFPYYAANRVQIASKIYQNIGMDEAYASAVRSFASLASSGQIVAGNSSNNLFSILGGAPTSNSQVYSTNDILNLLLSGSTSSSSSSGYSLYDMLGGTPVNSSSIDMISQLLGRNHVETEGLIYSERDGKRVLALSESQWELMRDIALNVWVDDGSGYIDLGLDNVYDFDQDGNLLVEYDGKWICINDQVVSYFITSEEFYDDGDYSVTGYVPALLNKEPVNILIEFTGSNVDGVVTGIQKIYEEEVESRIIPLQDGDQIDFICDYFDYSGNYDGQYPLGETLTVSMNEDDPIESVLKVGTYALSPTTKVKFGYLLTDIYNANYLTPMVEWK